MQTVVLQEEIKIWQEVVYQFEDKCDISSKEKLRDAVEQEQWSARSVIKTFGDTEETVDCCYDTAELDGVQYPKDENQKIGD